MYQDNPIWADVIPLPQDDGDQPLAQISYTEEYAEAMSYLRALMAKDEISERALSITEHITEMNPAHYTVWLYRAKVIFSLPSASLRSEIEFLNGKALRHNKSYQVWHHRQMVIDRLDDFTGELEFIAKNLEKDEKNYHVWSYRQWLVKRFGLWDEEHGELAFVEKLLKCDVRNNSAWNHRWFLVMGRLKEGETVAKDVVDREIAFAEKALIENDKSIKKYK